MAPTHLRYRCIATLLAVLAPLAACHRKQEREQVASGSATAVSAPVPPSYLDVTDDALAAPAGDNWLNYGGGFANQRYSTLDQISLSNAAELALAWTYQTGIAESFETTPVVAGTVMFLTTPESHVVALNAASGDKLWEFIPRLRRTALCCGPNNRGVAAYGGRVFVGTIDGHLVALDQRTGTPAWDVAVADSAEPASITMAPLAYDGRIFVGVAGGEFGIRGRVLAYDAQSGRELWRFYTIPAPGQEGQPNGWFGQWKETDPFGTPLNRDIPGEQKLLAQGGVENTWLHGGGGVYMTPAYDPATATVFFSVGNPAPDLNGLARPGDNLFTGSVVALDARTGQIRWYFQEVPHDLWDLSPASPPFLFDGPGGRRYLGQAGKTGWLYVLDAATGRPVIRSDNYVPQENLFAPPTDTGVRMLPGANGGAGWAPAAFSPRTRLAYVQVLNQPMVYTRAPAPRNEGELWLGGSFRYVPNEPQWSAVTAIDPASGQIRWQRQAPRANLSGLLATAGDLVFAGQADGSFDAFNARNGDVVWQYATGAGVSGGAMTYSVGGVQYVAIASGGNAQLDTQLGDNLYVFALRSKIPTRATQDYPEPRYTRAGPLRPPQPAARTAQTPAAPAPGAAPGAAPGTQPGVAPGAAAGTQPGAAPGAAGAPGAPGVAPPTGTPGALPAAPGVQPAPPTPGVAPQPGQGATQRPRPATRRPRGPRVLGRPVPGLTPPRER